MYGMAFHEIQGVPGLGFQVSGLRIGLSVLGCTFLRGLRFRFRL